ncbi:hypothetical protein EHS25_000517 [Saitozyma podzolica]|uniref:Uncharacterized protein n=1 Tax=Saitozyma podzolica TaxID=1890683 RepID=A0A427YWG0_9TREE|nr:hypothetical protein EHS25_000517 [Saitozyma podzolica]
MPSRSSRSSRPSGSSDSSRSSQNQPTVDENAGTDALNSMIDTMCTDPPIVIGQALLRGRLAWHQDEHGNMSNIRFTSSSHLDAGASAFIDSLLNGGALKVHQGAITHPGADGGVNFPDIPDDLEEDPIPVTRSIAWTTVELGEGFDPYLVAKRNEPLELVLTDPEAAGLGRGSSHRQVHTVRS